MQITSEHTNEANAFLEAFEKSKDRLYRLFMKHTRDAVLCEDLLQDCYLRAWEKRTVVISHQWENYIFGIAYNQLMDWHRKRLKHQLILKGDWTTDEEAIEDYTPATQLSFRETHQTIAATIARLSVQKQAAYRLIKEEEKSYKEAAVELQVPVSTLEKQVASCLKAIRKALYSLF
ncbi:RNA polymerase sigma factor, sigma-70 family [Chitinophaga terrae (ex Kim and Jung 2007)]|uniref:RNA polymerase sigma factor, sigma-70 family n=1 Tax=Chitinophaga terrae (ex Kim and Jung 2007) TaxID=408074 RepID=A0A1H4G0Q5_9BACT|nr:RNA polymerase sigma factor [Chitinophaga terrae (ex Kim and Jung 2007)]GEP92897.1 hypothetical protein CTE07_45420 [Chitinophaga terrae (ex Kim and Jung 2007)]SEB02498.1 RNA polymerase sigma factor, sigma-70 family [Chitinophaga terrae (ex Kim and Jung 2007)]